MLKSEACGLAVVFGHNHDPEIGLGGFVGTRTIVKTAEHGLGPELNQEFLDTGGISTPSAVRSLVYNEALACACRRGLAGEDAAALAEDLLNDLLAAGDPVQGLSAAGSCTGYVTKGNMLPVGCGAFLERAEEARDSDFLLSLFAQKRAASIWWEVHDPAKVESDRRKIP